MIVKIEKIHIGKYDVDSIEFHEDGFKKEICFDKSEQVEKYLDKSVELKEVDGSYQISLNEKPATKK